MVASVLAACVAGCSTLPESACPPGQSRQANEMLYFGAAKPSGVVSKDEWSDFLRGIVTPLFPQGLSSWQALGQWQTADGSLVREDSFVLHLVHPEGDAAEQAIQTIVAEYKARFQQEAVLRVESYACVSF